MILSVYSFLTADNLYNRNSKGCPAACTLFIAGCKRISKAEYKNLALTLNISMWPPNQNQCWKGKDGGG